MHRHNEMQLPELVLNYSSSDNRSLQNNKKHYVNRSLQSRNQSEDRNWKDRERFRQGRRQCGFGSRRSKQDSLQRNRSSFSVRKRRERMLQQWNRHVSRWKCRVGNRQIRQNSYDCA